MTHDEEALLHMKVEDLWNRANEITEILKMYHEMMGLMNEQINELLGVKE